jgi:hypothetical protein
MEAKPCTIIKGNELARAARNYQAFYILNFPALPVSFVLSYGNNAFISLKEDRFLVGHLDHCRKYHRVCCIY